MSQSKPTRQSDKITPPRAGQVTCLATSTSPGTLNMGTLGVQTPGSAQPPVSKIGALDCYVTIYADGADLGIVTGPTSASVASANAPVLATNGTNAAGCCGRIPAGQSRDFVFEDGQDNWLGYVASASGQMRIHISSDK